MKRLRVALLGFGVVGSGVFEMLQKPPYDSLVSIEWIFVKHLNKDRRDVPLDLFTNRIDDLFQTKTIDVFIEAMGGLDPAQAILLRAIDEKIHVITANKEVVDHDFYAFVSRARKQEVAFLFEASVVAGVPVISSLVELVDSDRIFRIEGILNGATNDVLTHVHAGMTFSKATERAREQGFLEADPRDDFEGFDALRKIMIMARIAFKREIEQKNVLRIGLKDITSPLIAFLKSRNWCLKQVAQAEFEDGNTTITVEPMILACDSLLGLVEYENNAVIFETEQRGSLCLIGKGAGKKSTAAAMVHDLMLIAKKRFYVVSNRVDDKIPKNETRLKTASYLLQVKTLDSFSSIIHAKYDHVIITRPISKTVLATYGKDIVFYAKIHEQVRL
jgi:homoserine dehydrogenase